MEKEFQDELFSYLSKELGVSALKGQMDDIEAIVLKKKCREIKQAKNRFLAWLKDRKAEDLDVYKGDKEDGDGWDYYRHVSAFVGETLYSVYFTMWKGKVKICYSDGENSYKDMGIDEFYQLLW